MRIDEKVRIGGLSMKRPIIIDCDPGVDDAIALYMAFAEESLDVRAITPVAGNQTLDKTLKNALELVSFLGADVKVSPGAERPLFKELVTAPLAHGESGMGRVVLPKTDKQPYEKRAWDTIYEEALLCEGRLNIIATAPLTNIALTLTKYPDIKNKIERITLMGGSAGLGNDSPAAEFNILVDPEAASIVFNSGIPITVIGLDVTHKAMVLTDELEQFQKLRGEKCTVATELIKWIYDFCIEFGFKGATMHDPFAIAAFIDPEVLVTKEYHVDIETKGEFTKGKTVVDIYNVTGKPANTDFGVDIDRERFISLLTRLLCKYEV